jgi:hypothetical protein
MVYDEPQATGTRTVGAHAAGGYRLPRTIRDPLGCGCRATWPGIDSRAMGQVFGALAASGTNSQRKLLPLHRRRPGPSTEIHRRQVAVPDGGRLDSGSGRIPVRVAALQEAGCAARHEQSELWIATPLVSNSRSNCATAGVISPSPGTTTAHSRFSRNSRVTMLHCCKETGVIRPICMSDQCRARSSAVARSGNGPRTMKWLSPCTRMPTMILPVREPARNLSRGRENLSGIRSAFGCFNRPGICLQHILLAEKKDEAGSCRRKRQ